MRQRTYRGPLQRVGLLFLFLLAASTQPPARAQQLSTASRSMDIFAFGGYTYSNPDYGSPKNNGVTAGVDIARYFRWPVVPSLEIRGNYTTGPVIKEESILFGLRLHSNFRRFHPYVDGLYGGNKINFVILPFPGYTYDIASAISVGGGVDIDLVNNFQAKFDFQNQFMNFGPNGTQPGNGDFTLSPTFWTGGVVYRIPFRKHKE